MIFHFLASGSGSAQKGSAGEHQVPALFIQILIHQEIFLLRPDGGRYMGDLSISQNMKEVDRFLAEGLHGTKKGRLFVQGFSAVGAESRGDVQGAVLDKSRRGGIPGSVASGLKGGPQSAGGEAGGVRFPFHQFLAGKVHDHFPVFCGSDEAVMFLGSKSGHGLEPVGEMGGAVFYRPFLHGHGHGICHLKLQVGAVLNGLFQSLINILGKFIAHDLVIEHQTSV